MAVLKINNDLEGSADHTVNIAEDILYMAKWDIFRHGNAPPTTSSTNKKA